MALQIYPNWDFGFETEPSGNPLLNLNFKCVIFFLMKGGDHLRGRILVRNYKPGILTKVLQTVSQTRGYSACAKSFHYYYLGPLRLKQMRPSVFRSAGVPKRFQFLSASFSSAPGCEPATSAMATTETGTDAMIFF
jgi:hypothetical protein